MWRLNILFLLFLSMSCNNPNSNLLANTIKISLNADSSCVLIQNIDPSIIEILAVDSLSQTQWQNNVAVYKKTNDDDLQELEKPIPGNYSIIESQLVFKPNSAFKKGERYLVALYLRNPDGNLLDQLRPSNSPFRQKPIQKIIKF